MDKGIRVNVNNKFVELLPQRAALGNTKFRASVIAYAMEEFGISITSAATHYNHAFKVVKVADPVAVEGLGRPEGKNNGGRKKKAVVVAEAVAVLLSEGVKENTSTHTVTVNPVQTVFNVCKKADGEVVASGLSFEDASAMVARGRNAKGHYCKMYFV
jgi:hypothetical protein